MTRSEKIKLLKDIASGKRSVNTLRPRFQVLIVTDQGLQCNSTGRLFKKDLSDLPQYASEIPRVILPDNMHSGPETYEEACEIKRRSDLFPTMEELTNPENWYDENNPDHISRIDFINENNNNPRNPKILY